MVMKGKKGNMPIHTLLGRIIEKLLGEHKNILFKPKCLKKFLKAESEEKQFLQNI